MAASCDRNQHQLRCLLLSAQAVPLPLPVPAQRSRLRLRRWQALRMGFRHSR
ncbi:hypothetical protein LINGRAHAP2_LOCUS13817 [Linum grandiflorum]